MVELIKKADEEIYEIEFSGKFIPDKFSPFWFSNKKLLGKKEAKNAQIVNIIEKSYCAFKTDFLEIYVETHRFRILSKNIKSYDLVNDMALSVAKILEESLHDRFRMNLRLHYSFNSKKELSNMLNKLAPIDQWNDLIESPKVITLRIKGIQENETFNSERFLSVYPCDRPDMKDTTHLYISDQFLKTKASSNIVSILEENENNIKSCIILANKIIEKYF